MRVVLASQSPRRRDLLNLIGIRHSVRPADIDESPLPVEDPFSCVERLARTKAERVAADEPNALVIGADTVVVADNRILTKPRDRDDAHRMLLTLQGCVHKVLTAVCVTHGADIASGVEAVNVRFRSMSEAEIDRYIATGEPMDKAGAYGIQGYGATIVESIEGDFFAVMGLPLVLLTRLMRQLGVVYEFGHISSATPQSFP